MTKADFNTDSRLLLQRSLFDFIVKDQMPGSGENHQWMSKLSRNFEELHYLKVSPRDCLLVVKKREVIT